MNARMLCWSWCLVGAALSLPACEPGYAGVELALVTSPPLDVQLGDDIVIPEGVVAAVRAQAFNSDGNYAEETQLTLSSQDSLVLGVAPSVEPNTFVLIGSRAGKTCIVVRINGKEEECLVARVTER